MFGISIGSKPFVHAIVIFPTNPEKVCCNKKEQIILKNNFFTDFDSNATVSYNCVNRESL